MSLLASLDLCAAAVAAYGTWRAWAFRRRLIDAMAEPWGHVEAPETATVLAPGWVPA